MRDCEGTELRTGDRVRSLKGINKGALSQPIVVLDGSVTFACGPGEFYLNQASLIRDRWLLDRPAGGST